MKVNVLFFGATADTVGESDVALELPDGADSKTALDLIFKEFKALSANHKRDALHFSINQEYSNGDEIISEGDELAVFTAVSGG
ncbi:MAG: MoaD/ThiS family protein [Acidobacteriota bacterium]|nr:MoaD/ThiS family protein [Acidobacteriota bacterium]